MVPSSLGLVTVAAALLASTACTNDAPRDGAPGAAQSASDARQGESSGAGDTGTAELAEFELDIVRAEAEGLLAMNERDLEPNRMLRIARRGDERFPATMDSIPGRMNVELDDHAGSFVVTRVIVETPDGNVVVE